MTQAADINAEPRVVTSIQLTRRLHEKLKRIAASENRSVSQQLRHLIEGLDDTSERSDQKAAA